MKKKISWHKTKKFPMNKKTDRCFKHEAIIGVGGNIGDVKKRFARLIEKFDKSSIVHVSATSAILKNPPFGYLEQDDFYNTAIILQTSLSANKLLQFLQHVERSFKRVKSFQNAPRTLDLDIIFYNKAKIRQKNLTIPHPHWHERDSVLLPLSKLLNKTRIDYEKTRARLL